MLCVKQREALLASFAAFIRVKCLRLIGRFLVQFRRKFCCIVQPNLYVYLRTQPLN